MQQTKSGIRLWSNNLNTIGHRNMFAELHTTCKLLQAYNVDIIALQEINLDLLNHTTRHNIQQIFKEYFQRVHISFSTTGIRSETLTKPGGIILVVTGNLVSNIVESYKDTLGR